MDYIRKNLLEHLRDLSFWKEFLESELNYKKESVTLITEDALKSLSYDNQTTELSKAMAEENKRLEQLLENREKHKQKLEEEKKSEKKSPRYSPGKSNKKSGASARNRKSTGSVSDRIMSAGKKK